ncbi:MAG TPA: hypothetical protein VGP41_11220 [Candidatus Lustribacter sp.]|jgi:hypothetical protein|nr:hypothetical protein [Candidatus Lustribacter sp.]
MRRSIFLLSLAGAAVAFATFHNNSRRRRVARSNAMAGRCGNARRKLRWSGYTAADFA